MTDLEQNRKIEKVRRLAARSISDTLRPGVSMFDGMTRFVEFVVCAVECIDEMIKELDTKKKKD